MRTPLPAALWLCLPGVLLVSSGCADSEPRALIAPDAAQFAQEAYPVLLRDCGFHACHSSSERFFQVYGPGRARLLPGSKPLDEVAPEEIAYSYERARSMLDSASIEDSLLLRKPLATAAGGVGHEGVDELGRNVYQSKADPGYDALLRWASGLPPAPPADP